MLKRYFLLFSILLSSIACGSYISMTTVVNNVFLRENLTSVNVSVMNSGDEAAYNVKISPILPRGFKADEIFVGTLEPNTRVEFKMNVSLIAPAKRGTYTMGILTYYEDANGYPFSSISPNYLIYKEASSPRIFGRMEHAKLTEEGSTVLKLKLLNKDSREHEIKVTLFLPNELITDAENKTMLLPPYSERVAEFRVSNFGALAGSTYVVFASLDYEDNETHYSRFVTALITVEREERSSLLIAIAVVLCIVLVGVNIVYKFRRGGERK